mgnify:CR=1 FL=1
MAKNITIPAKATTSLNSSFNHLMTSITFVLCPNMLATSVTLPLEMLRAAWEMAKVKSPKLAPLSVSFRSEQGLPVETHTGLTLPATALDEPLSAGSLVFLPALWRNPVNIIEQQAKTSAWLKGIAPHHTIAAVGTFGALLALWMIDWLGDTLGDGGYGNAKRIPSLLGTKDTGPWAWTGSQKTLRGQLQKSFRSTMHSPSPTPEVVSDLTAYLKTLPPAPSLLKARFASIEAKPDSVVAGAKVFQSAGCTECHSGRQFTADAAFDVELEDQLGLRQFNPPSLKGVSQRDRLLHDGRAKSLSDVLALHPPGHSLSREESSQLIEFLNSL